MNIAVYGLGYVGLTAAVCLAADGHVVAGVDISEDKVAQLNAGVSTFDEPGVADLLASAIASGSFHATSNATSAAEACEIAIVCVGTPTGLDGAHDMSDIAEVSRQIARAVGERRRAPMTVIYRSTVRPGTMEDFVRPIFQAALGYDSAAYELVYNPEFLREGVAVADFRDPAKIVVGTADGRASARVDAMHAHARAATFHTKFREAEITKFADNAFHALKVVFANELGRICQHLSVDVADVHKIFVSDTKLNISANYLRPGAPFGGACLPKDVRALQALSRDIGAETHVIDAVLRSNEAHKHYIFKLCARDLAPGARVLLLGLAFKANSDDLRESPNVYLARRLIESGFDVSVYDPCLRPEMLKGQNLGFAYSQLPAINELLVSRKTAENSRYDLVIDANDIAGELTLASGKTINIAALR